MALLTTIEDLNGLLKVDPNSYFPFKSYFSKQLQYDLYFFARLNTAVQILSDEFERLDYGLLGVEDYEKKYGPIGFTIRKIGEDRDFIPSPQEFRDIVRLIFKSQSFTFQERVVHNTTKFSNKLLIDIRKTGGEHPYHYILDFSYHVNPTHEGFKFLKEQRKSKEISLKTTLEELSKNVSVWSLNPDEERANLFCAMAAHRRGVYDYDPAQ